MNWFKTYIKSFLIKLANYVVTLPFIDISKIHSKVIDRMEQDEAVFITQHKRPKNSGDFNIKPQSSVKKSVTAIVLQGPVLAKDDFTYQSVLFYAKNFKDTIIIVSTWADEDPVIINKLKAAGAIVILNNKPAIPGNANINYQIVSSINGIAKAKAMGAAYVMKTRTDQRIYGLNVIDYFLNLIELYPLKNIQVQKQRLIIPSINTFLYRLYGITDMLMFGDVDDMILYWGADLDDRVIPVDNNIPTVKSFADLRVSEVYLCTEFLKKTGKSLQWTFEDSWKVFADNFCVVDHQTIDLYWPKYFPHTEYRNRYYLANNTHQLITFADWLSLYQNNYYMPPNDVLNYKVGAYFKLICLSYLFFNLC